MKKRILMLGICVLAAVVFCGCKHSNINETKINIIQQEDVKINANTAR
ncbi:MAG: hypothetical protein K5787_13840 [Lentisphaeria bacterium]|nr:hypothetical protein [Lentisphaeria bacterium]